MPQWRHTADLTRTDINRLSYRRAAATRASRSIEINSFQPHIHILMNSVAVITALYISVTNDVHFSQQIKTNVLFGSVDLVQRQEDNTSSSALAERPRCRVSKVWPKVEDCNRQTIGLSSTTVT